MKVSSVKRVVSKAIDGYSDKPEVSYGNDGGSYIVSLKDGNWAAREDAEKALGKHVDAVQNRPTGKTIYLKGVDF